MNASVVQGSVIGPVAYAIAASDLKTLTVGNSMNKFADDSYLLIPADNIDTTNLELDNIEKWAECNNFRLNRAKTVEVIFRKPRSKLHVPPEIPSIKRVESICILGVTISSTLSVAEHINSMLSSCNQSLYALRTLRSHRLPDPRLQIVFQC